jgi:cytochrome c-type biogenesis protein CcmH/NrfF
MDNQRLCRVRGAIRPLTRHAGVALALIALAIPAAAPAAEPQTSLPDIEDEVMCVVCGVTLELATESPQAIQERDFIRQLIAQGLTKDEIKDRLVAEFGSEVLAIPDDSGFDLAAWLVPGVAIVVAGVGIFIGLRRWRKAGNPPDGGGAAKPPQGEDAERLDADLARYEL